MYWRSVDPTGHTDALYSLAAIVLFAWILGAIGVFSLGVAAYLLLAAITVLVGVATLRRRV